MATSTQWMIYGANGYTGRLVAKEAMVRGLTPILAGRRKENVQPLAESLDLPWRAFDLANPDLKDVNIVLHCAGPFSATSRPMADALLAEGKHYLDITGEIGVFEALFARKKEATDKGSMIVPGVGFDVVPTDCLASQLKEKLPAATHLELAMSGDASLSPGTMKSMIEGFGKGGWVRRRGMLVQVPTFYESKNIRFSHRELFCSSIPWGDVSTAFYSTSIPNITFYASVPPSYARLKPVLPVVRAVMSLPAVQTGLKKLVEKFVPGPSEEHLLKGRMHLWGKVSVEDKFVEGWADVPEGYRFTALSSVSAVQKLLSGNIKPGVWTPSQAFGSGFLSEIPGAQVR